MSTRAVHWISATGLVTVCYNVVEPTFVNMQTYCEGDIEHVSVLFKGSPATMYVNSEGRMRWADRNAAATEIYFAASRARGIDPEDKGHAQQDLEDMAKRMGIPIENIVHMEDPATAKAPGIYGPAVLIEGYTS